MLTDTKVSAAAAVNPKATTIDTPGIVADAGRATNLPGKLNVAAAADVTPSSVVVVRRAGDDARRGPRWTSSSDQKLGAAAAIDPETATIDTPGIVADTGRATNLPDEAYVAVTTDITPIPITIIRRASDSLLRGASLECYGRMGCKARCNNYGDQHEKLWHGFHFASLLLFFVGGHPTTRSIASYSAQLPFHTLSNVSKLSPFCHLTSYSHPYILIRLSSRLCGYIRRRALNECTEIIQSKEFSVSTILVIEDDPRIQKALHRQFTSVGYDVDLTIDGEQGLERCKSVKPAAVVLDLMLPVMSGLEVCKGIKNWSANTPVVILSAVSEVADKVLLLEVGADDYVTKPFSPRELMARVQAAIRRTQRPVSNNRVTFGDIAADFAGMEVKKGGVPVVLTAHEIKLLQYFVENPERVITREELLNDVWHYASYPTTRTVDNHVMKLRQKLEPDPARPVYFRTMHGIGYKFVAANKNAFGMQ